MPLRDKRYDNLHCMWIFEDNFNAIKGSLSHGSWICNYLCNQCLSSLTLSVPIPLMERCTRCDNACQLLTVGRWFTPVHSTNKADRHDISELLLKVALDTIPPTLTLMT